jgi:hypothetical protein
MRILPVFCTAILLAFPAQACLNDRDTLVEEVRNMRSLDGGDYKFVVSALSGRFDRNPPLYYEMRLKRVAQELQAQPAKLDLYDDAAVACDRLGKSDEAIVWIEKKRAKLERLDAKKPQTREHWYRYYANVGTFWAHRWLHDDGQRGRIDEMKTARDLIKKAIAIKPNAHFGREKYQLKAMEWIINPPSIGSSKVLPDILNWQEEFDADDSTSMLNELKHPDAVKGLAGLIVLGNAWESVDVFNTLSHALGVDAKDSLSYMAGLRARELATNGRYSLLPDAPTGAELEEKIGLISDVAPDTPQQLKETFLRLRLEADEWQKRRTAYMLTRLQQGRHPDTDPTFWNEWHDDGPPPLRAQTFREKVSSHFAAIGVLAAASLLSLTLLRSSRQRRRASA